MVDQRNYFQLAVRITGLVVCLYGLHYLWEFATLQLGYWSVERTSASMYFASAAAFLVIGLYLIQGADHFMRYAFPDDDLRPDEDGEEAEAGE
jgi:hypothetical protein